MAVEDAVELLDRRLFIVHARCFDFFNNKRVTTDGTLAEHHQAAGQDVCAFHRDADGHRLVRPGQEVAGAGNNTAAGNHVHGMVDHRAHQVGIAVLEHR